MVSSAVSWLVAGVGGKAGEDSRQDTVVLGGPCVGPELSEPFGCLVADEIRA